MYVKIYVKNPEQTENVRSLLAEVLDMKYLFDSLHEKNEPKVCKRMLEKERKDGKTIVLICDDFDYYIYSTHLVSIEPDENET